MFPLRQIPAADCVHSGRVCAHTNKGMGNVVWLSCKLELFELAVLSWAVGVRSTCYCYVILMILVWSMIQQG